MLFKLIKINNNHRYSRSAQNVKILQDIKCVKFIPKITVKYDYNIIEISILWYNCFSSSVVPDLSRQIVKASFHGVSFGF